MKHIATTLLVAGLMASPMLALPPPAQAAVNIGIGISVGVPPPVLPVYAQPVVPGPGYIWTPGYWAWDPSYNDYYWVPGTWVMPPQVGLLWTPGWWGWSEGYYRWHAGYWGTHVGFYGGVNYGYGYFGSGYAGGRWRGDHFYYNRAVSNVNVTNVRNVYVDRTVINNVHVNRTSYNGGRGGLSARPTATQRSYANQHRVSPTQFQVQQRDKALRDPAQRFKSNRGHPAVFATQRAGRFEGTHAVTKSSAQHSRMVAAPRAHATVAAPGHDNRAPVNAPHRDRTSTPAPSREHRVMEAPNRDRSNWPAPRHAREQSMTRQREQPASRHAPAVRPQRANPPPQASRAKSRQDHRPPASHGDNGHHDKKKNGNDQHH
ncbi:MAG TPA: YXWGXW repeat-containing protein [Rhodanobacteraceae bacterium]|nr:YXWGXW repeat-containing protein [Rhodanobacteraceae bacterium]